MMTFKERFKVFGDHRQVMRSLEASRDYLGEQAEDSTAKEISDAYDNIQEIIMHASGLYDLINDLAKVVDLDQMIYSKDGHIGNMAEREVMVKQGEEEGHICNRNGCAGEIENNEVDNCSCHLNSPCNACVDAGTSCPICGWDSTDE